MAIASNHARGITHADLLHIDTHAEFRGELANQIAEIHALFRFEIENRLIAIEQVLNRYGIHIGNRFGRHLLE